MMSLTDKLVRRHLLQYCVSKFSARQNWKANWTGWYPIRVAVRCSFTRLFGKLSLEFWSLALLSSICVRMKGGCAGTALEADSFPSHTLRGSELDI